MTLPNWFEHPQYRHTTVRKLEQGEAVYALREAWKNIHGEYPEDKSLALLWAQSALETGRWKDIKNNNFGNIKKVHNLYGRQDDGHMFTMFATGENLWNSKLQRTEYKWFEPPHIQTHFRAYDSITAGAEDYINLLRTRNNFKAAWKQVLIGDPAAFSKALKAGMYYTADEATYTRAVVSLTSEFHRRRDEFFAWKPEPDTVPAPANDKDVLVDIPPPPNVPDLSEPIEEDEDTVVDNIVFDNEDKAIVAADNKGFFSWLFGLVKLFFSLFKKNKRNHK